VPEAAGAALDLLEELQLSAPPRCGPPCRKKRSKMHGRSSILIMQLSGKYRGFVPPIQYQQRLVQESLIFLRYCPSLHAFLVQPNSDQSIRHKIKLRDLGQPEPQIPILAKRQFFIERTGPLQKLPAHHHGGAGPGDDVPFDQQVMKQINSPSRLDDMAGLDPPSDFIDVIIRAINKTDPR
jgi:hypothetical protein